MKQPTRTVTARPTTSVVCAIDRSIIDLAILKVVSTPSRDKLALPIMRRLTEYKAIIVKIPANRAGIFILVCKMPVIIPASIPAMQAPKSAARGPKPATIMEAAVAAPSGKLPSTVKSAISSTRNVTYTPRAINAHSKPCATVGISKLIIFQILPIFLAKKEPAFLTAGSEF